MRSRIASIYDIPESDLIMEPIGCVRERTHSGELKNCSEEVQAVVLLPATSDSRDRVVFWPGVTGHESYYVGDLRGSLLADRANFKPTDGSFGPTKWRNEAFYLCAGGGRYDALRTSKGELLTVVESLVQRHPAAGGDT